MPLIRIKSSPGRVDEIFIAAEPIGHLASVYICSPGNREVKEGTTTNQAQRGGVSIGGAVSGALCRVVTHGIVSGVVCASSVVPGDRLTIANHTGTGMASGTLASGAGKVTPFNSITPAGTITRISGSLVLTSGALISGGVSGHVGLMGKNLINPGGMLSGVGGGLLSGIGGFLGEVPILTGTAFNTGRVLGVGLQSGGIAAPIKMLVDMG